MIRSLYPRLTYMWRLFISSLLMISVAAAAAAPTGPERSRDNFMVVVRESIGAHHAEDAFSPMGKVKPKLPDGREVEFEMASWEYIGDLHIRFVFDQPHSMIDATPQDLAHIGVKSVEDGLALAIANIRRVYNLRDSPLAESPATPLIGKRTPRDSPRLRDMMMSPGSPRCRRRAATAHAGLS